jgi:hypothetical protein
LKENEMRFVASGPSIPDELLLARDQGRVIFFCGAGVSRAKANLPDFFGLAREVTRALGVVPDDPAMKIIAEIADVAQRTGVEGLISADRIFGLLERSFLSRDIEAAVARALAPKDGVDLSAHKTLVRLATTRDGMVRLVTTNFDRLFDGCRPGLQSFLPPKLPNPARATELNGIVYLHGKMNALGTAADGDGFVLSSSEFGRAYLSDGWATAFVKDLLVRYSVVFIGYSADDPPVQYLLEALNRTSGPMEGVYAFQSGDANYANLRWSHKGVTPIAYDSADGHLALWDTLEAWAVRADDPEAWTRNMVSMAGCNPADLKPHERGQVVHVVSTVEGLRKFTDGDPVPPASWLCVFDPHRRFAKPGYVGRWDEDDRQFVDPFDLYCLDSDPVPAKVDQEDHFAKRETPPDAFDAFRLNKLDRHGLEEDKVGSFRGYWAKSSPRLPARQFQLGVWLSKVAGQPEAVWWASKQTALHPSLREVISWRLSERDNPAPAAVRQAWRYLFDFWEDNPESSARDWIEFSRLVANSGWSDAILRRFATLARPFLIPDSSYGNGPTLAGKDEWRVEDLIRLDVKYPDIPRDIQVPDGVLARLVSLVRRALESAVELENEIGGYGLSHLSPINPDEDGTIDRYSRGHGLSAWLLYYVRQFQKLVAVDRKAGLLEAARWPRDDDTVFARLHIWALGRSDIVSKSRFRFALGAITADAFWDSHHARDLLLGLAARWNKLSTSSRKLIETRLLQGPTRWHDEDDDHFSERRAWSIANRLTWLRDHGCEFEFDLEATIGALRAQAPKWQPEYAQRAADSLEGRSGSVRTETEHTALDGVPISAILAKALEISGRRGEHFVEYAPFAGLSGDQPVRAFAALRVAASQGEYPEWAWRAFLNPDRRKSDSERLTRYLAERISRYPPEAIAGILRPVCDWIQKSAEVLATRSPELFRRLISAATAALAAQPDESSSAVVRGNNEPDWTMEAINSPTGHLAEALFDDPVKNDLVVGQGLPEAWSKMLVPLLALPGDLRRHAIVICSYQLNWLYAVDPLWTEGHLLSILDGECEEDRQALWAGFLWAGKAQGYEFFRRLKPHLLRMASSQSLEKRGQTAAMSGLILSAWALTDGGGNRWVTDDELRTLLIASNDDIRTQVLWQAERWASDNSAKWASLVIDLLRNVWPRHLAAKSGPVSARLCDIAFSNEENFAEISAIILPLLTKVDSGHLSIPELRRSGKSIVDKHPRETLSLLHAVLPDRVTDWPYGIGDTLARLAVADASLVHDQRLVELRRRWDSR